MTIIVIATLIVCLAWCWYIIYKQNKRSRGKLDRYIEETRTSMKLAIECEKLREENKELDKEADRLDEECAKYHEELKCKNDKIRELCRREDEALEAWAELKCNKHINLFLGRVKQGNKQQYVVYEIKGIEIISRYGTASEMWELVNSNKEIYTDYKKAQQVLREQLEKGLQGEKEQQKEVETMEYVVGDAYLKGEITEAE